MRLICENPSYLRHLRAKNVLTIIRKRHLRARKRRPSNVTSNPSNVRHWGLRFDVSSKSIGVLSHFFDVSGTIFELFRSDFCVSGTVFELFRSYFDVYRFNFCNFGADFRVLGTILTLFRSDFCVLGSVFDLVSLNFNN